MEPHPFVIHILFWPAAAGMLCWLSFVAFILVTDGPVVIGGYIRFGKATIRHVADTITWAAHKAKKKMA